MNEENFEEAINEEIDSDNDFSEEDDEEVL